MFKLIFSLMIFMQPIIALSEVDFVKTLIGDRATGLLGPGDKSNVKYFDKEIKSLEPLPESFSWRDYDVLPPMKNQGSCGSCTKFAQMGALESALAIHQGIKINLSEQEALDCRRGDSWGCNGALMTSTDYLLGGVTTERNYPYVGWQTRCKRFEKAAYATEIKYLGSRNRRPSIDEIKAALIKYGPLVVDVYAGGSGWSGRTDKVTSCRRVRSTNHAVLLTGFSERGFEFKNSWGNWADNGYSFIGYNCDGFATEAIAVLVEGSPE